MKIFKHVGRLFRELGQFAWQNKLWWMMPLVLLLILITAVALLSGASAPYIYTLF